MNAQNDAALGGQALEKLPMLLWSWRLRAMAWSVAVGAGLYLLPRWMDDMGLEALGWAGWLVPMGLSLVAGWFYAQWRFAHYGARLLDGEGLVLRSGVWWRTEAWVPIARLQHLEVHQGPLDRLWGMASLALHTAGSHDHQTRVQGLPLAQAQALRSALLPRVQGVHE